MAFAAAQRHERRVADTISSLRDTRIISGADSFIKNDLTVDGGSALVTFCVTYPTPGDGDAAVAVCSRDEDDASVEVWVGLRSGPVRRYRYTPSRASGIRGCDEWVDLPHLAVPSLSQGSSYPTAAVHLGSVSSSRLTSTITHGTARTLVAIAYSDGVLQFVDDTSRPIDSCRPLLHGACVALTAVPLAAPSSSAEPFAATVDPAALPRVESVLIALFENGALCVVEPTGRLRRVASTAPTSLLTAQLTWQSPFQLAAGEPLPTLEAAIFYSTDGEGTLWRHAIPWSLNTWQAWLDNTLTPVDTPQSLSQRMSSSSLFRAVQEHGSHAAVEVAGLACTQDFFGGRHVWVAFNCNHAAASSFTAFVVRISDAATAREGHLVFPTLFVPRATLLGRVVVGSASSHSNPAHCPLVEAPEYATGVRISTFRTVGASLWFHLQRSSAGSRGSSPTRSSTVGRPRGSPPMLGRRSSSAAERSPSRRTPSPSSVRASLPGPAGFVEQLVVVSPDSMLAIPVLLDARHQPGIAPCVALIAPTQRVVERVWIPSSHADLHVFHLPFSQPLDREGWPLPPPLGSPLRIAEPSPPHAVVSDQARVLTEYAAIIKEVELAIGAIRAGSRPHVGDSDRQGLRAQNNANVARLAECVHQCFIASWMASVHAHYVARQWFHRWLGALQVARSRRSHRYREHRLHIFSRRSIDLPRLQTRYNCWMLWTARQARRHRALAQLVATRITNCDLLRRRYFVDRWVRRTLQRRQHRAVELLAGASSAFLKRRYLSRWVRWAAVQRAAHRRGVLAERLARVTRVHEAEHVLRLFFRRWCSVRWSLQKRKRQAELRDAALSVISRHAERALRRHAWGRWARMLRLRAKAAHRRRLAAALASSCDSGLRRSMYQRWALFAKAKRDHRTTLKSGILALLLKNQAILQLTRFDVWRRVMLHHADLRQRSRLRLSVETLLRTTAFGLCGRYFSCWLRYVARYDGHEKHHMAAATIRQRVFVRALERRTCRGLMAAYWGRWHVFLSWRRRRREKRRVTEALVSFNGRGILRMRYSLWNSWMAQRRTTAMRRRLAATMSRSTGDLLRRVYFSKWRRAKALRLKRRKQLELQQGLLTNTRRSHTCRRFRFWVGQFVRSASRAVVLARRNASDAATRVAITSVRCAAAESLLRAAERGLAVLQQKHDAAVTSSLLSAQCAADAEQMRVRKEARRSEEQCLIAQRRQQSAALRGMLSVQLEFADVAKQQLSHLDDLLQALRHALAAAQPSVAAHRTDVSATVTTKYTASPRQRRAPSPVDVPLTARGISGSGQSSQRRRKPSHSPTNVISAWDHQLSSPPPPPHCSSAISAGDDTLEAYTHSVRRSATPTTTRSPSRRRRQDDAVTLSREHLLGETAALLTRVTNARDALDVALLTRLPQDDRHARGVNNIVHRKPQSLLVGASSTADGGT